MDSRSREHNSSRVVCSSALTDGGKKLHAHFYPTQQRLQLTLELSQSLAAVLEGENSLARHFNIPLASDTMAGKIDSLFGNIQLVQDDQGEVDNDIRWLDIVLATTYTPKRREDGYYYLQLNGRKGLIRVAESDHNFIESGLPQKLINPRFYPSDVQSEEETMRLVEELLLNLNELASQIIDVNNDCRAKVNQRLGTLMKLSQNTQQIDGKPKTAATSEPPEPTTHKGVRKGKSRSTMPPWKPQELDRLPQWFPDHKHLTKKQVETEFKKDFGSFRTFGAIVAAHYRARNEFGRQHVGSKRKLDQDDSLPPSTAPESAGVGTADHIDLFSSVSDSTLRLPVSFLTPLRSLCSPETSNGGTMERRFTNLSHQTACMEVVTPHDTAESPLRNEYPAPSNSRAEVEDFDPSSTAVLHPTTEQTTRDSRSSERGDHATQLCPTNTNTRESNKSDGDVFGAYGVGNVASTQPANSHHQVLSDALFAPANASGSRDAQSSTHNPLPDHTAPATMSCLPLSGHTPGSSKVIETRPENTRIQPEARDHPGQTLLLPVLHQQELSPATTASAQTTNPVRRTRKARASVKEKGSGTGCITCRRRKSVCDRRSPACNTCVNAKLLCEGYILRKPSRHEESSTPRSQGSQQQQEDHEIPTDSLDQVVEQDIAALHGLPGPQHGMSATRTGSSPWMPLSGSDATPGSPNFVFGQDAPVRGVLTAANRLPPPLNPDTGPQVMPPIDQVLNGQYMPSNQLVFRDWSAQA